MLKTRVLTAIVLILALFGAVFFLDPTQFRWVSFAVVALGFWEWSRFCGFKTALWKFLYIDVALLLTVATYFLPAFPLLCAAAVFWLAAVVWLVHYQTSATTPALSTPVTAVCGIMVLAPFWIGLNYIRDLPPYNIPLLLFTIALICVTDTGAYFTGRSFGKRKLAVKISPGKSVEGVIGGLCAAGLLGCAGAWYFWSPGKVQPIFALLCVVVSAMSVVGDLLESFFKRQAGMKDSSNLLPGHGGILDRLDSMTAAIPLFALGLMFIQGS